MDKSDVNHGQTEKKIELPGDISIRLRVQIHTLFNLSGGGESNPVERIVFPAMGFKSPALPK
jgi:hypothetical protein